MIVDGETFDVVIEEGRSVGFSWVSDSNPGYGFGGSRPTAVAPTRARLESEIRSFLSQIDPGTGYIADP